jgi:antitoxin component YwqK of YwqJK toxin-antitoxin module
VSRFENGAKLRAEYLVGGKVVGSREFHETGELAFERPLKEGRVHGTEYRWDCPGELLSEEPYVKGLPHGTARQWLGGKLIGSYTMVRGTGIDLWWQEREDGSVYLSEVYPLRDGRPHGFEWWLNEDQETVCIERHYWEGKPHGIWREWNSRGRLCRGFPEYYVGGVKVTRPQYLRAAREDPTLPPFREEDNEPRRRFPPEIARHLRPLE